MDLFWKSRGSFAYIYWPYILACHSCSHTEFRLSQNLRINGTVALTLRNLGRRQRKLLADPKLIFSRRILSYQNLLILLRLKGNIFVSLTFSQRLCEKLVLHLNFLLFDWWLIATKVTSTPYLGIVLTLNHLIIGYMLILAIFVAPVRIWVLRIGSLVWILIFCGLSLWKLRIWTSAWHFATLNICGSSFFRLIHFKVLVGEMFETLLDARRWLGAWKQKFGLLEGRYSCGQVVSKNPKSTALHQSFLRSAPIWIPLNGSLASIHAVVVFCFGPV